MELMKFAVLIVCLHSGPRCPYESGYGAYYGLEAQSVDLCVDHVRTMILAPVDLGGQQHLDPDDFKVTCTPQN